MNLVDRLVFFVPLLLSLTVHEWAHAWTAWKLGDDTAKHLGRVSLNPIDHIDPVGTVLLPLLGVPFGWAKPVPFNPTRFRHSVNMSFGTMLVAVAGPISNFLLALAGIISYAAWMRWAPELFPDRFLVVASLLQTLVLINFLLGLFNLLPVPPLDGSRIADYVMPQALRPAWNQLCSMGPALLVAVIVVPMLLGASLFELPINWIVNLLSSMA